MEWTGEHMTKIQTVMAVLCLWFGLIGLPVFCLLALCLPQVRDDLMGQTEICDSCRMNRQGIQA